MKKIMLACSAGMSTSLLEKNMNDYAKANKIDAVSVAYSAADAKSKLKEYDVILIGPQVRYMLNAFKEQAGKIPVEIIPPDLYAMGKGKEVLEIALKILK